MSEDRIHLTSSEIASLWSAYINDSMSKCVLGYMVKNVQDEEIKSRIQFALEMAVDHLKKLRPIIESEKFSLPIGFNEQDVNMEAPWLFSDIFCLTYVNHMAKVGMLAYSGFVSMSSRRDIRDHFSKGLSEACTLFNQTTDTALAKGLYPRHPYIEVPKEKDYVDSKKYLYNKNRPLNSIEISHLYMNVMTNTLGEKLSISFAQTSPTKEIQNFMLRGKEISQKHIKIFASTLLEDDILTPQLPDVSVSNSTTRTFSDKLMMYHMSLLSASGSGNYATAAAASQRSDLVLDYERLSLEIAQFAKDGADIMIKNKFLEQPPGTKDRDKLAKKKEG